MAFSPDGTLVAAQGCVALEVATGHIIRTFTGHTDLVAGVAFKPDGTLLATASHDKTARLWEVATASSDKHVLLWLEISRYLIQ